ncbi:transposase domain-containing protein [Trichormus azollae]|uniref:transposase domain-containing protein n=1 Tax=Trichormus azollae TaxID=1164 RepID=UPI003D32E815
MSQVIPLQTITNAIETTCTSQQRLRILPTYVIVTLVITMSFWSSDSRVDVFKNVIHSLSSLHIPSGLHFQTPSASAITEASQRTGAAIMRKLFELVAKPLATILTLAAFLGVLRIMAIDGTVFDVPDTPTNARVFGYPGSPKGTYPALPKVRLVF